MLAWAIGVGLLDGIGLTLKMVPWPLGATFRGHAIEPSVNKNHVIDWFRAVVIICLPTETVKALVIVTIRIDHEDRAQVIVAAVGGRAVEFVADQEKRAIGIFAIVMGFTKLMKQVE